MPAGDAIDQAEQSALVAKWSCSMLPCVITEREGLSAGTAVCVRPHIGMTAGPVIPDETHLAHPGRIHFRKVGAICRGGIHMAATYFRDKVNGKWPSSNIDMLHHIAAIIAGLVGPWIIGADWNCTPVELLATGWLKLVGGTIAAPKAPTCNGNTYDFFVVANALGHAVFSTHTIGDAQCAPHSPSRLLLRAKPRAVQVQVILFAWPL